MIGSYWSYEFKNHTVIFKINKREIIKVETKNINRLLYCYYQPSVKRHYLIFFIPAEIVPCGKLLWPLHHEVDEVSAAAEAADDQEVCQNSQEPPQVDVLILLVLLLIHDGLLFLSKKNWQDRGLFMSLTAVWELACDKNLIDKNLLR